MTAYLFTNVKHLKYGFHVMSTMLSAALHNLRMHSIEYPKLFTSFPSTILSHIHNNIIIYQLASQYCNRIMYNMNIVKN